MFPSKTSASASSTPAYPSQYLRNNECQSACGSAPGQARLLPSANLVSTTEQGSLMQQGASITASTHLYIDKDEPGDASLKSAHPLLHLSHTCSGDGCGCCRCRLSLKGLHESAAMAVLRTHHDRVTVRVHSRGPSTFPSQDAAQALVHHSRRASVQRRQPWY